MKIISHRGGAKLAPENSIEAIKVSRSLGVDAAEIDIRVTKDGQLVVFHDKSLKRLAGINKAIKNLTVNEIKQINLKSGAKIPTLEELLNAAGDLPLIIEGKGTDWANKLAISLQNYQHKKSLRVISFNEVELGKFKELQANINCYHVGFFNGFKSIKIAMRYGYQGIDVHYLAFNPFVHSSAKKNNLNVILYTPNSTFIVKLINYFYPDIEITTDSPDKLLKLVKPIED